MGYEIFDSNFTHKNVSLTHKRGKMQIMFVSSLSQKEEEKGLHAILILNLGLFHDQEKLGQLLWGSLDMKKIIVLFNFNVPYHGGGRRK